MCGLGRQVVHQHSLLAIHLRTVNILTVDIRLSTFIGSKKCTEEAVFSKRSWRRIGMGSRVSVSPFLRTAYEDPTALRARGPSEQVSEQEGDWRGQRSCLVRQTNPAYWGVTQTRSTSRPWHTTGAGGVERTRNLFGDSATCPNRTRRVAHCSYRIAGKYVASCPHEGSTFWRVDYDTFASSGTSHSTRYGFGSSPRPSPGAQGRATHEPSGLGVGSVAEMGDFEKEGCGRGVGDVAIHDLLDGI